MSEQSPASTMKIACPFCAQKLDLSDVPPFSKVECPACKHSFKAPRRLDGFLLEEVIGEGRVSVVYRALDVTLDRDVAIKVLRRNVSAAPKEAERFLAEARKLAVMTHPRIIPIFTCGEDDGSAYIGMQLMHKSSLSRWLREKREMFTPEFSLFVALAVAQGLEAARQKGIIHGNVSPQNILFDDDNEPRIGDFGMANSAWDSAADCHENVNRCYSTVEYLSPELGLGGVGDERSDIYGLGAIMYHMLACVPPFSNDNTNDAFRHRQDAPPPALPPHVKVAPPIAELIASMLSGIPNRRPLGYGPIIALLEGQIQAIKDGGSTPAKGDNQKSEPLAVKRKVQLPVAPPALPKFKAVPTPGPKQSIDTYMPKTRKKDNPLTIVTALLFLILVALIICGGVMRAAWYVRYVEPLIQPLARKAIGPNGNAVPVPAEMPKAVEPAPASKTTTAAPEVTPVPPPVVVKTAEKFPVPPSYPSISAAPVVAPVPPPLQASVPAPTAVSTPQPTEEDAALANMLASAGVAPVTVGRVGGTVPAENSGLEPVKTEEVSSVVKVDVEKRPRPDDLNFKKVQDAVDAYMTAMDNHARKRELTRINMITQLRNEWMHSKIGYDANNNGVRLKNGRTIRGMLMVNENRMVMMMRNSTRPLNINWDDIGTDQYIVFLEDHVRQKTSRMGRSAPPDFAALVGNDCFRLAVLFDWYKRPSEAAKYAKDAIRYNPELAGPVNGYFPANP